MIQTGQSTSWPIFLLVGFTVLIGLMAQNTHASELLDGLDTPPHRMVEDHNTQLANLFTGTTNALEPPQDLSEKEITIGRGSIDSPLNYLWVRVLTAMPSINNTLVDSLNPPKVLWARGASYEEAFTQTTTLDIVRKGTRRLPVTKQIEARIDAANHKVFVEITILNETGQTIITTSFHDPTNPSPCLFTTLQLQKPGSTIYLFNITDILTLTYLHQTQIIVGGSVEQTTIMRKSFTYQVQSYKNWIIQPPGLVPYWIQPFTTNQSLIQTNLPPAAQSSPSSKVTLVLLTNRTLYSTEASLDESRIGQVQRLRFDIREVGLASQAVYTSLYSLVPSTDGGLSWIHHDLPDQASGVLSSNWFLDLQTLGLGEEYTGRHVLIINVKDVFGHQWELEKQIEILRNIPIHVYHQRLEDGGTIIKISFVPDKQLSVNIAGEELQIRTDFSGQAEIGLPPQESPLVKVIIEHKGSEDTRPMLKEIIIASDKTLSPSHGLDPELVVSLLILTGIIGAIGSLKITMDWMNEDEQQENS